MPDSDNQPTVTNPTAEQSIRTAAKDERCDEKLRGLLKEVHVSKSAQAVHIELELLPDADHLRHPAVPRHRAARPRRVGRALHVHREPDGQPGGDVSRDPVRRRRRGRGRCWSRTR